MSSKRRGARGRPRKERSDAAGEADIIFSLFRIVAATARGRGGRADAPLWFVQLCSCGQGDRGRALSPLAVRRFCSSAVLQLCSFAAMCITLTKL